MNDNERIKEVQRLTADYFKTAELLKVSYDEVRCVCEGETMKTFKLIDKNSDMIVIIGAENEKDARQEAYNRLQEIGFFRCEQVDDEGD